VAFRPSMPARAQLALLGQPLPARSTVSERGRPIARRTGLSALGLGYAPPTPSQMPAGAHTTRDAANTSALYVVGPYGKWHVPDVATFFSMGLIDDGHSEDLSKITEVFSIGATVIPPSAACGIIGAAYWQQQVDGAQAKLNLLNAPANPVAGAYLTASPAAVAQAQTDLANAQATLAIAQTAAAALCSVSPMLAGGIPPPVGSPETVRYAVLNAQQQYISNNFSCSGGGTSGCGTAQDTMRQQVAFEFGYFEAQLGAPYLTQSGIDALTNVGNTGLLRYAYAAGFNAGIANPGTLPGTYAGKLQKTFLGIRLADIAILDAKIIKVLVDYFGPSTLGLTTLLFKALPGGSADAFLNSAIQAAGQNSGNLLTQNVGKTQTAPVATLLTNIATNQPAQQAAQQTACTGSGGTWQNGTCVAGGQSTLTCADGSTPDPTTGLCPPAKSFSWGNAAAIGAAILATLGVGYWALRPARPALSGYARRRRHGLSHSLLGGVR
jgi:hypothetical protein